MVAITRNGTGVPLLFGSLAEARLHPVVQIGDVVASDASELMGSYWYDPEPLLGKLPQGLAERWRALRSVGRSEREVVADEAWRHVLRTAARAPTEPAAVVEMIISDRRATEGATLRVRGVSSMTEHAHESKAAPEATAKKPPAEATAKKIAAEPKPPAEGGRAAPFRMDDAGVITFGKDAEGNAYGPANVPKRGEGTKEKFGKYRDGLTVQEALGAGLTRSDIRRDRRAGYIVVKNPEAAAAA